MYQPQPQHLERQDLGYHVELDYLEDPGTLMPSKIKSFECSACNASFHMRCFLNMHVRKVHGKELSYSGHAIDEDEPKLEGETNTAFVGDTQSVDEEAIQSKTLPWRREDEQQ